MANTIDWQECLPKIQGITKGVFKTLLYILLFSFIIGPFLMIPFFATPEFTEQDVTNETVGFWIGLTGTTAIMIGVLYHYVNEKLWCEILCRITVYGISMMLVLLVIRAAFRDIPMLVLLIVGAVATLTIGATVLKSEHISRYKERVACKRKATLIAGMIEIIAFIVGGYCAVMLLYANDVLELPKVSDGLIAGITLAHLGLPIGLYYLLRYVWQQYLLRRYRHSKILQEEILPSYDGDTVLVEFGTQSTMVDAFIEYGVFCNRVYDNKLNDADRYHIRFSHFMFLQKAKESREWLSKGKIKKRKGVPL